MRFSLKESVGGRGQLQEALLKSTLSSGPVGTGCIPWSCCASLAPDGLGRENRTVVWVVSLGALVRPVGFNQFAFGPELSLAFGKCMFQVHSGVCSHLIDERRLLGSKCHWETKS